MTAVGDGHADSRVVVSVASGPMVTPVLGRVIGIFAARAELPLDRLNDAILVGDALASSGRLHARGDRVEVGIEALPRRIDLRVGPLVAGGGERLLQASELPGIGEVLSRLADEVRVDAGEDGDYLHLAIVDR